MDLQLSLPESRSVARLWIKRAIVALVCAHVALAGWGFYRRIWQVLRLDLHASSNVLTPGETVSFYAITSGEVPNRIVLELVQGSHAEVLVELRGGVNAINMYDPRIFRYARTVAVSSELLGRFDPGPATLRLTGFGGMKLLRTPAPRVREVTVQLKR